MKFVERPDTDVEISGLGESAQMTIKADARAFRNLVDSIYAEKEKTVVRELIANAFDAHAAAGTPEREVVVHLPTVFEPTFSVRDHGVGMSHEFVMKSYTSLFESSKQGDNGQTGMFGVGSKSPLAITDSFIVKCYDPATADTPARIRRYNVVIPNAGVPEIKRTFDAVPDEEEDCCGVEVIVPIKRENRDKLLQGLAEQQFFWFDKPIRFEGAFDEVKSTTYSTIIKLSDGLYYAPKQKDSYSSTWKLFARQGAAVYPIIESQVREFIEKPVSEAIRALCDKGNHVLLDLPIGTAEVTLARESIQYGEQTRVNIAECVNASFAKLADRFKKCIGDSRFMFNAFVAIVNELHGDYTKADWDSLKLYRALLPLATPIVQKNFQAWVDSLTVDDRANLNKWDRIPPSPSLTMDTNCFPEGKVLLHAGKVKFEHFDVESPKSTITIRHPHILYIIPAHLQKWQDRIKKHVSESKQIYSADIANSPIDCYIVRCAKKSVDGVVEAFKQAHVYTGHYALEDLPQVEDAEQRQRSSSKTSVYKWIGDDFSSDKMEPDYLAPAYFVERIGISQEVSMESVVQQNSIRRAGKSQLYSIHKAASELGIIDATLPLYRVTENQADKIEKQAPSWQRFPDVLLAGIAQQVSTSQGILDLRLSNLYTLSDYRFDEFVRRAYAPPLAGGHMASLRKLMEVLTAADPVFKTILGFKIARQLKKDGEILAGDSKLAAMLQLMGMDRGSKVSSKIDVINELTTEYSHRYKYLVNMCECSYNLAPSDDMIKHLSLYVGALANDIPKWKHTVPPEAFSILAPFAAYYDQQTTPKVKDQINDAA